MGSNEIGSIKSINGTSMAINTQKGDGANKPNMGKGDSSPGMTKPPKAECKPVPMPKG
jgi:hypothetical protein